MGITISGVPDHLHAALNSPYGTGPDAASAIEDLMWQLKELEDV